MVELLTTYRAVTAYCALHIQIWLGFRTALYNDTWATKYQRPILTFVSEEGIFYFKRRTRNSGQEIQIFYAPYVVFFAFTIGTLAVCSILLLSLGNHSNTLVGLPSES